MRKLISGLLVVTSFALADEMPLGSKQQQVIVSYQDLNDQAILFRCVSEVDRPGVEVTCIGNLANEVEVMPLFDQAAIENNALEAVDASWKYQDGEGRYTRSYRFSDGGTLEAVFAPDERNRLYVFYMP